MAGLRTIKVVVDTTPKKLGDFVSSKAWMAATNDIGEGSMFKELGILTWDILAGLPEIKRTWVVDALLFFLKEKNREMFQEYLAEVKKKEIEDIQRELWGNGGGS